MLVFSVSVSGSVYLYKQINSVIYLGQKKGGRAMEWKEKWESEDFSQGSYNGIEKGTRNRARGREREMEGTKDITRSYTNLLCIHTNVYIVENLG